MSHSFSLPHRSPRLLWSGGVGATGLLLVLVLVPPLLPLSLRTLVMEAFAPVCHQMPSRSPHLGDFPIAVCDRCFGIYLGVFLGVATVTAARPLWQRLGAIRHYFFLASLAPLAIDWIGPILGVWGNGPGSRFGTGLLFGVIAASFVMDRLLQKTTRSKVSKGFDHE